MIRHIKSFFKRFKREDGGNMTIEFVFGIPLVFGIFLTTAEMGIYTVRQMFLDRGVDMAVRNVRLNTGVDFTHAALKTMVCDFSGFLENCEAELSLSMNPINIRTYTGPSGQPSDCTNTYPEISPLRNFVHGGEHELMLVVACYEFRPIFPTTGLGFAFSTDTDLSRMYGFSGFVQEPS
jgi:hypothetical protein